MFIGSLYDSNGCDLQNSALTPLVKNTTAITFVKEFHNQGLLIRCSSQRGAWTPKDSGARKLTGLEGHQLPQASKSSREMEGTLDTFLRICGAILLKVIYNCVSYQKLLISNLFNLCCVISMFRKQATALQKDTFVPPPTLYKETCRWQNYFRNLHYL